MRTKIDSINSDYKNQLKKAHLTSQELTTKYDEKCDELSHQKHIISYLERKAANLTDELTRKTVEVSQLRKRTNDDELTIEKLKQQVVKLQSSYLIRENNELKQQVILLQSQEKEDELKKFVGQNMKLLSERESSLLSLKQEVLNDRAKLLEDIEQKESEFHDREEKFYRLAQEEYNKIEKVKLDLQILKDQEKPEQVIVHVPIHVSNEELISAKSEIDDLKSHLLETKSFIEKLMFENDVMFQTSEKTRIENENKIIEMSSLREVEKLKLINQIENLQKEFEDYKKHEKKVLTPNIREPLKKSSEDGKVLGLPASPRYSRSPQPGPIQEPPIMEKIIRGIKDESLDLSNQKLSSIEFLQLCVNLGENKTVQTLNLCNIGLSNRNIHHLTNMLCKNKTIQEVRLDGNVITDWKSFDTVIKCNSSLKKITFDKKDDDFENLKQILMNK